jgi:hypothetical protein
MEAELAETKAMLTVLKREYASALISHWSGADSGLRATCGTPAMRRIERRS